MRDPRQSSRGVPVDDFLQAIAEQLDKAQDALALKARTGRPLTWALRDFKIALQVFVELDAATGQVLWRTAGPNESGASTVNLEFTTITKPMIEENSYSILDESDARPIDSIGIAADLDDEDKLRLRRLGVRTVGQLRRLAPANERQQLDAIGELASIPVGKLEAALRASARPSVQSQDTVRKGDQTFLRIRGANLHDGINTEVRLAGEPVEVVDAKPNQLLVRPMEHHSSGQIEVMVGGERATGFFRMPQAAAPMATTMSASNGSSGQAAAPAVPSAPPPGGRP